MAVSILSKRFFHLLRKTINQKSKFHAKFKVDTFKERRNLNTKTMHRKNGVSTMYKINLASFYNGSIPLYNVSTYENLVNQKSTTSGNKKCSSENNNGTHPGRHKFHKEIESALNDQIEMEFNASFAYLSMASYFGRTEVALPGCQGYFMMMHQEEHEHAVIFLNYILMRGGHVKVPTIAPPDNPDWKDITKTFAVGVEMERQVKEKLEALVELAEKQRDHQLVDFVSSQFLVEQNKSIQSMARLMTRSKMVKDDVGEHLFDQHLYESFVKESKDNLMYATDLPEEEAKKVYK